jgi:hypothetical protein
VNPSTELLLLRVAIAPAFVGVVSVASLVYGHRAAGWLVSLPINTGTILVVLTVTEGTAFAATAALGALAGIVSLGVFAVGYGRSATRFPWPACLALASGGFVASTLVLSVLPVNLIGGLTGALLAIVIVLLIVPRPNARSPVAAMPKWEIPVRMALAALLVFGVTTSAVALGPRLSGLLSPIPVFTITLVIFTHSRLGPAPVYVFLNGLLVGLFSFAAFCAVVAVLLVPGGLLVALAAGLGAFLAVYAVIRLGAPAFGIGPSHGSDAVRERDPPGGQRSAR